MFSGSIAQLDELLFLFDSWVTCELVMGLSLSLSSEDWLGISIFRKIIFIEILRCCWVAEVLIHTFFFCRILLERFERMHTHTHLGRATEPMNMIAFFFFVIFSWIMETFWMNEWTAKTNTLIRSQACGKFIVCICVVVGLVWRHRQIVDVCCTHVRAAMKSSE